MSAIPSGGCLLPARRLPSTFPLSSPPQSLPPSELFPPSPGKQKNIVLYRNVSYRHCIVSSLYRIVASYRNVELCRNVSYCTVTLHRNYHIVIFNRKVLYRHIVSHRSVVSKRIVTLHRIVTHLRIASRFRPLRLAFLLCLVGARVSLGKGVGTRLKLVASPSWRKENAAYHKGFCLFSLALR